ncbi:thioredoxin reductase (NADPH) [Nematocida sp. AWRm77]|nr:thioredoxin reductase (NADPH) [Nematocida sp. AWRm77]
MSMDTETHSAVIIGSGPAAYSAALYLEKHSPLMLAGNSPDATQFSGGQLCTTTEVDNYPGYPSGIQGPDLVENFVSHAQQKNISSESAWVEGIVKEKDHFLLYAGDKTYKCKSVVVATGSVANRLYVKGTHDGEFWQRGISACATCDGWRFGGADVMVIGGGDTAMEEVLYLASMARKVVLIHRSESFRARPDKLQQVRETENVEIKTWRVLKEARGTEEDGLTHAVLENPKTKEEEVVSVTGMFFAIGHTPNSDFMKSLGVELDKEGYVKTDKRTMQTSVEGVFAAGDVQDHRYRQAITAAYSGMVAGRACTEWLDNNNSTSDRKQEC